MLGFGIPKCRRSYGFRERKRRLRNQDRPDISPTVPKFTRHWRDVYFLRKIVERLKVYYLPITQLPFSAKVRKWPNLG